MRWFIHSWQTQHAGAEASRTDHRADLILVAVGVTRRQTAVIQRRRKHANKPLQVLQRFAIFSENAIGYHIVDVNNTVVVGAKL